MSQMFIRISRLCALALCLCVLFACPAHALAGQTITIGTAQELYALLMETGFSSISDATIKLSADIDMTAQPAVKPLGRSAVFSGVFDGQGHAIRNLKISNSADGTLCTGLVGYVGKNGVVRNLGLDQVEIQGNTNAGGIAGVLNGSAANCYVTGQITGKRYTGGIAGMLHAGAIENCWTDVAFSGSRYCGGLFGGSDYDTRYGTSASQYSPMTAAIKDQSTVVRNNLAMGSVVTNRYGGGMLGDIGNSKAAPMGAFEGNVSWMDSVELLVDDANDYYGAIFAWWSKNNPPASVNADNLYWKDMKLLANDAAYTTGTIPVSKIRATPATADQLGKQATYEALGWDFTNTWVWNAQLGHPVLKNVTPPLASVPNPVNIIEIATPEDLIKLTDPARSHDLSNDIIRLTADIDMRGKSSIQPICVSMPFNGTFDGQDHIIYNLKISKTTQTTGLFGCIGTQGVVKNLGLVEVAVTGNYNTGAIAGVNTGRITECFVTGSVNGQRYTGSIAGMLHAGEIENCWADTNLRATRHVGGLFGGTTYDTSGSSNAYSTPLNMSISDKPMLIRNNLTLGSISANRYPAGIAGDMYEAKTSPLSAFEGNVAWVKSVTVKEADKGKTYYAPVYAWWNKDIKGLKVNADNLYFDDMALISSKGLESSTAADCTPHSALRVKASTAATLSKQATYEALGWDFENVWIWNEQLEHPVLRGFNYPAALPEFIQKTPASLVTTFAGSPKTTRAFTWYTDATVEGTIVQAVPESAYRDESSFSSGSAISVSGSSYALKTDARGTTRHIHKANLTGLTAGTAYRYRAGDGTNWSKVYTFTTEPEDADSFTFLSMTDTQNQYSRYADALNTASRAYPDAAFIVHSGDVVQNNQTGDYDELFSVTQDYAATLPTMVSPGNHELGKDTSTNDGEAVNYVKGLANYKSHFQYPSNGPAKGDQIIYSFDYGDVHFIMLNSNMSSDYPDYDEIIRWLESDLKDCAKPWKVISMHHGPYSNSNPSKKTAGLRKAISDLGVDLLFFGHNHTFLRSDQIVFDGNDTIINPTREQDGVFYAESDGTVYYSSGCAGGEAFSGSNKYFAVKNNPTGSSLYGAITVTEDTLTLRTHSVPAASRSASVLLDTLVICKPKAAVSAAPTPISGVYNGREQALITPAATADGVMLYSLDGVNYTQAVPTAANAGEYTIWYKVKGGKDHSDSDAQSVTTAILPMDITGADITLGEQLVYTGSEQEQTIERVSKNGVIVDDYLLSGNTATEVGDGYELTITGKGNFTGTASARFSVLPAPTPQLPQTGDSSSIMLWLATACMSAIVLLRKRRTC